MLKWAIAFLSVFMFSNLSFADISATVAVSPSQCNGNVNFAGVFVDVICTKGYCQAQIPSQEIHVEGNCAGEINYSADGIIPTFYVSGTCNSGKLSFNFDSQTFDLYGDCIFEDNYYASFYTKISSPFGQASGFCQADGMSRIYLNGGLRPFLGLCRKQ